MSAELSEVLKLLAYVGMALGIVGVFLPVLPGCLLILASAFLWAWADGFQSIGWPTLAALAGLTVVAEGASYLTQVLGARRAGATWKGVLAASVGAVVGLLVFSLPGAVIGAIGALLVVDYRQHQGDIRQAGKLTLGVLLGYAASYATQLAIALVMIIVFLAGVLW